MKPNFALGLTDEGITLWFRDPKGWLRVGAVSMDAADMDDQMQKLVASAKSLAPAGVTTQLVIPDDQILFARLTVEPTEPKIRAALQGKTPYPVEDLAFDWITDQDGVLAAVVARETLAEAEEFAAAQGLNPQCFVAAPAQAAFTRQPFFGQPRHVAADMATLCHDDPILREVGVATLPAAPPADKPAPAPTSAKADPPTPPEPKAPASAPPPVAKDAKPAGQEAAPPPPTPASRPTPPKAPPAPDDDSVAFRSRRGTSAEANAAPVAPKPSPQPAPSETLKALSKTRSLSLGALGGAALAERLRASVAAPVTRAGSNLRSASDLLARKRSTAQAPKTPEKAAAASAPSAQAQPAAAAPARNPKPNRPDADPEAERLTVFGARRQSATPAATMPRRALLISGAALLLVLAIGLWAFYFTRVEAPDLAQPVLPGDASLDIAAPDALTLPDASDDDTGNVEAALGLADAAQNRDGVITPEAETSTPDTTAADATDAPSVAAPAQDAGRLAALRSVRAIAPESPSALPVFQGPPAPFGATPLPPLRGADAPQAAPDEGLDEGPVVADPSPLPPEEVGLDIVVTQGRPSVAPPQRPEGIAPAPEPDAPDPVTPEEGAQDTSTAPPDLLDESALVIDVTEGNPPIVPPTRPDGIAPENALPESASPETDPSETAPSEEGDQASLAPPPGGVALTMLSPAPRPAQIAEQASAMADRFASATAQAVAASRRPSGRPSQFSQNVQRALAAASARQTSEPQAEIVQASAASAAPRIPSSASVSRAATQARAINLRQINLLGVMGTPSARRALVRLDNGRVVTVAVGERLDGGQVTAISDSELRYTRRGRDVVLRLAS